MDALIVTGSNQYGVVSNFISGMVEDASDLGVKCHILDVANDDTLHTSLNNLEVNTQFDFIICFNGLGLDITIDGLPLPHKWKCPLFVFLVDHPIHLLERFFGINCTVLCVDQTHVQFCELCGIKAHFFPHALATSQYSRNTFSSVEEKTGVIAPLSYFDIEHWKNKLATVWPQINQMVDHSDNIWEFMCHIGILPTNNQPARLGLDKNVITIARCVDYYLRGKRRINSVQRLGELDMEISVFGTNSQKFDVASQHFKAQGALAVSDTLEKIQSAKYLFHSVPGFSFAIHERILFSVSMGTIPICDDIVSIKRLEPDFRLIELNCAGDISNKDYEQYREDNLGIAAEKHTWKKRLDELLYKFIK